MSEKVLPNVFYAHQKRVTFKCPHTVAGILPHALEVGATTICVECLIDKLPEVMVQPQNTTRMWCATCQRFRQTLDGVCTVCGGKDLRD